MSRERNLPIYAWPTEKKRLEAMRQGMEVALDRRVVMAEVIQMLLAEHDKAMEVETA